MLVDDTPLAFLHQPENGVPVLGFRGDPDDRLLLEAVLPLIQVCLNSQSFKGHGVIGIGCAAWAYIASACIQKHFFVCFKPTSRAFPHSIDRSFLDRVHSRCSMALIECSARFQVPQRVLMLPRVANARQWGGCGAAATSRSDVRCCVSAHVGCVDCACLCPHLHSSCSPPCIVHCLTSLPPLLRKRRLSRARQTCAPC